MKATTEPHPSDSALPRVCIIGAGVSGLTTGKALADRGIPYTCFETSDDVGGNWYFGNPNGRSSAYRSLHIDTSKKALAFRDFPIDDGYPDFLHHSQIMEYLRSYADAFGLREHIRFGTTVQQAERGAEGGWRVALSHGAEEWFDALVVCNGHHWDPSFPDPAFPGTFDGPAIHSHDYIDPTTPLDVTGRRVLVVGIGNSAADIVSELSRKGVADHVFLSTRSGAWVVPKYLLGRPVNDVGRTVPWLPVGMQRRASGALIRAVQGRMEDYGLPTPDHRFGEAHPTASSELLLRLGSGDATAKPNVAELQGDRVRFADGTVETVDAIVYATGYRVTFPFFDPGFISARENRLPLFKRMFKPGIDDLAFVGLAQAIPTIFQFSESQSRLLALWLAGEWALPEPAAMEREIAADEARFTGHYSRRQRHTMQVDTDVYRWDLRRRAIPDGKDRARRRPPSRLAGRAERARRLTSARQAA